jgi:hypothetical protein
VLSLLFAWIVVSMVIFAIAVIAMPADTVDQSGVLWLAVLAFAWPLLLLSSLLGIALTYAANLLRSR